MILAVKNTQNDQSSHYTNTNEYTFRLNFARSSSFMNMIFTKKLANPYRYLPRLQIPDWGLIWRQVWCSRAVTRLRTRQNFEPVHIIGPVQNFGPPARNFGPLRAEFAWREWRKTLGGHVANWAGLSGFSPRENKISHTFFIDFINKYSKVSNAHNSDDCHGVFNGGMLNKGWSFSRSRFDCLGLMHFFHG